MSTTTWNDRDVHGWAKAVVARWRVLRRAAGPLADSACHSWSGPIDAALDSWLLGGSPNAELRQRVEDLTVSRDASVDVAEAERRRIERDLHDGVQPRLVTLAMDLGRPSEAASDGDADPALVAMVTQAHDDSKRAVAELRDMVRGIHPAVLTDRGLDAAVSSLAARSPIPVDGRLASTDAPAGDVESAAYFVIAEA